MDLSVILPVYNGAAYLPQAVSSVQRQTYGGSWELWIIDDASRDETPQVAASLAGQDARIHYHRQPRNQGVAAARNQGLELAAGRYVAFLDADDWWEEDKLRLQLQLLARTGAVLCCTGRELMQPDGQPTGRVISVPERITYRMLMRTNLIPCGSVVAKTEVIRRYGFVHDECHEDYILWLRILRACGPAVGINRPMLKCRLSTGGKSRNKLKSARMHYGSYRYLGYGRISALYYTMFYAIHGVLKYYG